MSSQKENFFTLHHSEMEFGTWHIFLYLSPRSIGSSSRSKTNDNRTCFEMIIIRSHKFQILRIFLLFTSCFTYFVEFLSFCSAASSWFSSINKMREKSLKIFDNFMRHKQMLMVMVEAIDCNHHQKIISRRRKSFHARIGN